MKQVVVISGKGGTGKTSITAALAGVGPQKVIADCDVDAADLHLILDPKVKLREDFYSGQTATINTEHCIECGQCAEQCRFNAISVSFEIVKEKCEGCGLCEFICPTQAVSMTDRKCGHRFVSNTRFGTMVHAALGIGEENSGKLVTAVRKTARELAEAEKAKLVLVDGSPGIGCPVIASLTDIDFCILVAEPTVSAVHDLKRVHELARHFEVPCTAILNKCGINESLENEIRKYCRENEILILGEFPYDTTFSQAQIHGKTVAEFAPDTFGPTVRNIWSRMAKTLELPD